ncbi:MAG: hypothetical protein ACRCVT_03915 [Leadbetterella sp.]
MKAILIILSMFISFAGCKTRKPESINVKKNNLQELSSAEITKKNSNVIKNVNKIHIESYIQEGNVLKTYPEANNTELHAGGVLFGRVLQNILTIYANRRIELKTIIYNKFRPMDNIDEDEVAFAKKFPPVYGSASINDRGYILFDFEDFYMVGLPLSEEIDKIVFTGYNKKTAMKFSILYFLDETKK